MHLQESELVEQSIRFYKWIVLYHTTDSNLHYAERLLRSIGKKLSSRSKPAQARRPWVLSCVCEDR